jgi:histidinol-phosphate aminotransferase
MENPYTWPEEIKAEWLKVIHKAEINRYPDPEAKSLGRITVEIRSCSSIINVA